MSSNPSKYLLASMAAETNESFRRRVQTACDVKGVVFTEAVLLGVLMRFSHNLQPVMDVVGVDIPLTDANIDTALGELFPVEDEED